jgi:nucleotide-binding universal stress UspA family protein
MAELGLNRWTHPAVILVATDLSDLDRLMPHAFAQSVQTGARLLLLHVVASSEAMAVDAVGMPYYDPSSAIDFAAKSLQTWCDLAARRGISCDAIVREGHAAQQVLAAVRQFHADRILLGTRSRGKMSKLFLGSVAEQVLRSVNLPVMTVGPEAHLPVEDLNLERVVLHATTLREASRPSAALACQVASTLHARLILLHVLPSMEDMSRKGLPTGLDSTALVELQAVAEETRRDSDVRVDAYVVHGNPDIEILAEAQQNHASLIVLAARQRSALQNLTRDRTIYKVLAHARCPVLTLREPQTVGQDAVAEPVATKV